MLAVPLTHTTAIFWLSIYISQGRASLTEEKEVFAHEHEEMKNLEAIVQKIKPTALIGKCFSTLFSFNLTYLALFCFLKILNRWNPEGKWAHSSSGVLIVLPSLCIFCIWAEVRGPVLCQLAYICHVQPLSRFHYAGRCLSWMCRKVCSLSVYVCLFSIIVQF